MSSMRAGRLARHVESDGDLGLRYDIAAKRLF
jgi:hypothetical protein